MENERCCGTCTYHRNGQINENEREWMCGNVDSDNCGAVTRYEDSCFDWEERE